VPQTRIEARRDRDPGIRVEEDTPVDRNTSDRIRTSHKTASELGESRKSLILIGESGTGKTHLAIALAIYACQ